MTTIDFSNAAADFDMQNLTNLQIDDTVDPVVTQDLDNLTSIQSYTTIAGHTLTLFDIDLLDVSEAEIAIPRIEIDLAGTDSDVADIVITDAILDTEGFELATEEGVNAFWLDLLDGETTIIGPTTPGVEILALGNGLELDVGVVVGEFTTMSGIFATSYFGGGVEDVSGSAVYVGGGLDFKGFAYDLTADADDITDDARVFGGDDTIEFVDATLEDLGLDPENAISPFVYGDAYGAYGNSFVSGGDDIIDMRAVTSAELVTVYGDLFELRSSAFLKGGNDTIYGAVSVENKLVGDVAALPALVARVIAGDDLIYGGDEDDDIYGDTQDSLLVLETDSSGGNDTLYGGAGNDEIFGGGGNDRIYSGEGSDYIEGDAGKDRIFVEGDSAAVFAGDDADLVLVRAAGEYSLDGGDGIDRVSYYRVDEEVTFTFTGDDFDTATSDGFDGDHTLNNFEIYSGSNTQRDRVTTDDEGRIVKTNGGNDVVVSGDGNDIVELGEGNDIAKSGLTGGFYDGGDGIDTITYSASNAGVRVDLRDNETSGGYADGDLIRNFERVNGSNVGEDLLLGSDGVNTIKGLDGDDRISARDGNDKLFGGDGEDYLDAGAGRDTMFGGDGVDTFHIDKGHDVDIISDFENNVDRIELDVSASFDWRDNATQRSDGVLINLGGGDLVLIEDALIGQLTNDLFIV